MTKSDRLSSSFSKLSILSGHASTTKFQNESLDLDTVVQNDTGRKLFTMYLKEFNNSCDKLVTLYLICCCMQNQKRIDDRQRIKQILEKTYNVCCIRNNELTYLSPDLKMKLGESLQRKTYNESIFNAVKSELKTLLEATYFPQFKESKYFADNATFLNSLLDKQADIKVIESTKKDRISERHSTSLVSLDSEKKPLTKKADLVASSSFFAMPNVPKNKQPLASNPSSRVLKQSKSSSSSTSSMASVSSTTATSKQPISGGPKTLRTITSNKSASKTSLSNLESSRLKTHYKSNTSINSLPPNPYHVASKAIPVSAQDSERQSVMSADDVNCNKKTNSLHHLPKMNKQIKENLLANKNAKLNMPEFNNEQALQPMKKPPQTSQCPLSESNPQEFFNIIAQKLNDYLHATSTSDIDAQLDDHLSRVYNNTNENNPNTSKMSFVKVSSLSKSTRHDRSLNQSSISYSIPQHHHQSSDSNNLSNVTANNLNHQHGNKHQHHFNYKLTSTSKEVDIDDTTHHTNKKEHKHSSSSHSNRQNLENYDSGLSIRSAASNERVNEWLNQSSQAEEVVDEELLKKQPKRVNPQTPDNFQKKSCPQKSMEINKKVDVKTTVAYYLPGEELAYISTFNGEDLTLAQFKQLIAKKGQFRYFFKTKSDLLDEECVVYQEATEESSTVPMFNSKVIAKIETC